MQPQDWSSCCSRATGVTLPAWHALHAVHAVLGVWHAPVLLSELLSLVVAML